jgi:N-glycosylase/DNA lyase
MKVAEDTAGYHAFPPPSSLAAPEVTGKLRALGFGYRAEFIQRTAQMLLEQHGTDDKATNFLHSLRTKPTSEAREELLKFVGVGRKVADCVLLMSMDKVCEGKKPHSTVKLIVLQQEIVPVDTHVHQIAIKHYNLKGSSKQKQSMTPRLYEEVQTKLANVWGPWAGWAHTVLFTADLRAFENYGLEESASAVIESQALQLLTPLPTPEKNMRKPSIQRSITTPSPSKTKRRWKDDNPLPRDGTIPNATGDSVSLIPPLKLDSDIEEGLVDRIKRRRRAPLTRSDTR